MKHLCSNFTPIFNSYQLKLRHFLMPYYYIIYCTIYIYSITNYIIILLVHYVLRYTWINAFKEYNIKYLILKKQVF